MSSGAINVHSSNSRNRKEKKASTNLEMEECVGQYVVWWTVNTHTHR